MSKKPPLPFINVNTYNGILGLAKSLIFLVSLSFKAVFFFPLNHRKQTLIMEIRLHKMILWYKMSCLKITVVHEVTPCLMHASFTMPWSNEKFSLPESLVYITFLFPCMAIKTRITIISTKKKKLVCKFLSNFNVSMIDRDPEELHLGCHFINGISILITRRPSLQWLGNE